MTDFHTISTGTLKDLYDANSSLVVLDVRTPAEFRGKRIPRSISAPLEHLNPNQIFTENSITNDDAIYLLCQSGIRARKAYEKFKTAGIRNVFVVEGGIASWEEAGLPVIREREIISLERQVRIAAGSLVLSGLILGFSIHPLFMALSAFVGAGLVFAGITDTCGMALLLARMPWNQTCKPERSCQ